MSAEDRFAAEVAELVAAVKSFPLLPAKVRHRILAALVLRTAERLFLNPN